MKKINIDNIIEALEKESPEINMDETLIKNSYAPMKKMLELSR